METVEQLVGGKRKRNPAVSQETFIDALKTGSLSTPKLTGQQVADNLGMGKGSFDQRLNAMRMNWRAYGVIIMLKQHFGLTEVNQATGADFTQEKLDKLVAELKTEGTWDEIEIHDDFLAIDDPKVTGKRLPKPFPFVLLDGRGEGNGGGGKHVESTRNAIFAAMMGVDAKSTEAGEPEAE